MLANGTGRMFKSIDEMSREELEAEILVIWAFMTYHQRLEFILGLDPELRATFFPNFKMEAA